MTTQTIQFETVSPSEIGSGTITAFLFSGATLTATLASITENVTLKGRHTGTVTDIAAGTYRLVVKFNGHTMNNDPIEVVTLLLADGTYVTTTEILADTNELQTDWVEGGRLDLLLDARASGDALANAEAAILLKLPATGRAASATAVADLHLDVEGNTGYLAGLTSSMATLLGRITAPVYTMFTDLIAMITGSGTAAAKFDTEALSLAPTGGGGSTTTIVTLQSVAGISPGVIVGPSEPLVIGDDYLTTMNRSIRMNLLDSAGDPATVVFGTFSLADVDCSIKLLLRKSGKPTAVAQVTGTCTFFPAVGAVPPYLIVEFTRTQTALATPGAYDMQAEARWTTAGQNVTFAPYGQIEFVRDIQR